MSFTSLPENSPAPLHIESRWLPNGVVHVAVTGEVDLATSAELQATLFRVASIGLPRYIEVNLAGVSFMACSGLSALVAARQAAARADCHLRITEPQPIVRRVLELTGLLGLLTVSSNTSRPRSSMPWRRQTLPERQASTT